MVTDQIESRQPSSKVGVCIGSIGMSENWKRPLFRTEAVCVGVQVVCGNGVISLGSGQCHTATLPHCHSATVPRGEASAQLSRCSPATLVPTTAAPYSTTRLWDMQKKDNTNCIYVLTRRTTKNWVIANFTKYWNMSRIQRKKIHCTVFLWQMWQRHLKIH